MERQGTTRQRSSPPFTQKVERKHSNITENDLRLRAYEIYLQRGPNPGDEIGDWLQAERELKLKAN
jgi:hypothetical protein